MSTWCLKKKHAHTHTHKQKLNPQTNKQTNKKELGLRLNSTHYWIIVETDEKFYFHLTQKHRVVHKANKVETSCAVSLIPGTIRISL